MRWRTLDHSPPKIIAHRGASGVLPEHTLEGYQLALDQGADLVEPDLVPSGDGVLFARHDAAMGRSTDIQSRASLASRRVNDDWPCHELSAADLDSLRAVQPFAARSHAQDGKFRLPSWEQVLGWAQREAQARGVPIVLYPELKHPALFLSHGIDVARIFAGSIERLADGVQVWVQCLDSLALKQVWELTGLPCSLVVDQRSDWRCVLHENGGWLSGLVCDKRLIAPAGQAATELVVVAHAAGIRVDAWTFRDDQVGSGWPDAAAEMSAAMEAGVDGLFCDFPESGILVRKQLSQE